jgi:hypothetical protein
MRGSCTDSGNLDYQNQECQYGLARSPHWIKCQALKLTRFVEGQGINEDNAPVRKRCRRYSRIYRVSTKFFFSRKPDIKCPKMGLTSESISRTWTRRHDRGPIMILIRAQAHPTLTLKVSIIFLEVEWHPYNTLNCKLQHESVRSMTRSFRIPWFWESTALRGRESPAGSMLSALPQ